MKLSYFAKIELRSVTSGGAAATLYVSTHGGHRNNGSSVVYHPPFLILGAGITNEFGKAKDPYQVPARLLVTIKNPDAFYDAYLPAGSDPQYFDNAAITLYEGDATIDGATLASMVTAFVGKIAPGTLSVGDDYFEFDCYDIRVESNQPICKETWSDHAGYVAGGAGVVNAGQTIPAILGDFDDTSAKIPAYIVANNGTTVVYAVCNHAMAAIGASDIVDSSGNVITPSSSANWATRGEFSCTVAADADYQVGETLYVKNCFGYSASLTDAHHVRLIQFILTQFGGLTTAFVYNDLGEATNNKRGSFKVLYDATGGSSSPEYPTRLYVADKSTLALNAAANVAYECNCTMTVVDNEYRIYWETPLVASNIVEVAARYLDASPIMYTDPDSEFCTVIQADYDYSPGDSGYLGNYDSAAEITSGPIDDQRDVYRGVPTQTVTKQDVVLVEQYQCLFDASTVARSVQRRLFWRIRIPKVVEASLHDDRQDGAFLTLGLYSDVDIQRGRWSGAPLRILSLKKNPQNGVVTVRGLSLGDLPAIGMWTNDSGEDGNGNVIESYWSDASGFDSSGNLVGVWI